MKYSEELHRSMMWLSEQPETLFLGQSVEYPGNAMYNTMKDVPIEKRLEMPVAEEMQMGITLGLALKGFIPISCYPRFDFLILATNQLINHIDKTYPISKGKMNPKPIIRVGVGSVKPLFPGLQHCQNHVSAFKLMSTWLNVVELTRPEEIFPAFMMAYEGDRPTLMVEYGDMYNDET